MLGLHIPHLQTGSLQIIEQAGNASALGIDMVGIGKARAIWRQLQPIGGQLCRDLLHRLEKFNAKLFFAHPRHQGRCVFNQENFTAIDHSDTVGNRLSLFDVMGGQNNGDALPFELGDRVPHIFAQLDIHASGWLIQKQDLWLMGQGLSDQNPALHPTGQRHNFGVFLVK